MEDVDNGGWDKPAFPSRDMFKLKLICNWTEMQATLSIYYQGNKLNETNDEYTILLPEIEDKYVWYPCVSLINKDAYCIIRYE